VKEQAMNDGGGAFPWDGGPLVERGMSLRAWLAGQALNGLLAGFFANKHIGEVKYDVTADAAVKFADATLARLGLAAKGGGA